MGHTEEKCESNVERNIWTGGRCWGRKKEVTKIKYFSDCESPCIE